MLTLEQKTAILETAGRLMVAYLQAKPRIDASTIRIGSPDTAEILRCLPAACSAHGIPYVAAEWPLDRLADIVEPVAPDVLSDKAPADSLVDEHASTVG